jgi:hypothetical protein
MFQQGLAEFFKKCAQEHPLVQVMLDTIPNPATAQPWNPASFTPIAHVPQGTPLPLASFSPGIMQVFLNACQRINPLLTLNDLNSSTFNGTLKGLWNILHNEDNFTIIDSLRGATPEERESCREVNNNGRVRHKPGEGTERTRKSNTNCKVGKKRRAKEAVSQVQAISFHASDKEHDPKHVIVADPNLLPEEEKTLFKNEIGIDENWAPREGMHSDVGTSAMTTQVRGGLILSEAILLFGKHHALRATLTNPMEFKKVNGHRGIVVAAKTLQERAGAFANEQLKDLDAHVWTAFGIQCAIDHIRVKHWKVLGTIPEGAVICVALFCPDSTFCKNLVSFRATGKSGNMVFAPNHAMSAILQSGVIMVPNAWAKFEHHARGTQPNLEILPCKQPTIAEEEFAGLAIE